MITHNRLFQAIFSSWTFRLILLALALALALAGVGTALAGTGTPSVTTDKQKYHGGETMHITGSGFLNKHRDRKSVV